MLNLRSDCYCWEMARNPASKPWNSKFPRADKRLTSQFTHTKPHTATNIQRAEWQSVNVGPPVAFIAESHTVTLLCFKVWAFAGEFWIDVTQVGCVLVGDFISVRTWVIYSNRRGVWGRVWNNSGKRTKEKPRVRFEVIVMGVESSWECHQMQRMLITHTVGCDVSGVGFVKNLLL